MASRIEDSIIIISFNLGQLFSIGKLGFDSLVFQELNGFFVLCESLDGGVAKGSVGVAIRRCAQLTYLDAVFVHRWVRTLG